MGMEKLADLLPKTEIGRQILGQKDFPGPEPKTITVTVKGPAAGEIAKQLWTALHDVRDRIAKARPGNIVEIA